MNEADRNRWKSEVLDVVFEAMAASDALTSLLIYKGARVLNRRLASASRQSLDLDSSLTARAGAEMEREEQMRVLKREVEAALDEYFEAEDPVRYELGSIRVVPEPRLHRSHPQGWNAFNVKLEIRDLRRPGVRGLPGIEVDVAAPEALLPSSTEPLQVGGYVVAAYSLSRLAGEKLRAFLSTLPEYRLKVRKPGEAVRVKDVYDLARIHRRHPLSEVEFWRKAGMEFRIACESRYVDCAGISTFEQDLDGTRRAYANTTLPKDVAFEDAWECLREIVRHFEAWGVVPFHFPLPGPAE